jgi:hypothetical protein
MIGNRHTRRGFLRGAAGAGAVAAGLVGVRGVSAQTAAAGDSIQTMLNLAATMEAFASTHMYGLLTMRDFELTPREELQAKVILDAELKHLDLISKAGGQPLDTTFFVPADVFKSRQRFGQVTAEVETVCTAAYLAAARRLAELGEHRMAGTMGQLAANEAQHAAVARDLIGAVPSDNAWLPAFFYNVSDAAPVLAPFLNGANGFMGPMAFPGFEKAQQVLGSTRATAYPTFMNSF